MLGESYRPRSAAGARPGAARAEAAPGALTRWLSRRAPEWQRLVVLLEAARRGPRVSLAEALELLQRGRGLARDVALARHLLPGTRLTAELEALLLRVHACSRRPARRPWSALGELLGREVPAATARLLPALAVVAGAFLLAGLAGAWLVWTYPELAALFLSEQMITRVEQGELWTAGLLNVLPASLLALSIMANNIVVTLTAFVLGAFYGLGTLYIIGLNGLLLGAAFAFTARHGLALELLAFVLPHGIAELSIVCIAGAAGVHLGEALVRPGLLPRREAFEGAVAQGAVLLVPAGLLLVGAGLLEGYVAADPNFGWTARIAIGLGYGALAWLVFLGPWRASDTAGPARARRSVP